MPNATNDAPNQTHDHSKDGPVGLVLALLLVTGAIVLFLSRNWLAIALWSIGAVLAVLYFIRSAPNGSTSTPHSAQANRSRAIGLALVALVAIFYIATMTRLKGNALNKPAPYFQKPVKEINPADLPKPQ